MTDLHCPTGAAEINLMIAGQAGQGLQTIARTLGRMLVRAGHHVFISHDVMSRIRGGHNSTRLRVASGPVATDGDRVQVLVALDPVLAEQHVADLAVGAVVVADAAADLPDGLNAVRVPLVDLAQEHGRDKVTVNSVAVGAALALVGLEPAGLEDLFRSQFAHKSESVVKQNMAAAEAGFFSVEEDHRRHCPHRLKPIGTVAAGEHSDRVLISGAEAMALGAIAAGVRVVTGYPMSPATSIVEYCFRHAQEAGLIVEQTEDEVSAANLAIGAAFAGARAMTCTAGGGFCLMNEALSLAGMTETPLVLCVGMRPGPGTGLATRTAQADLLFAITAGHGEFPRAVLTPADATQGFYAVQDAVRIAEKYQTPAIVLFDQFMADSLWTVERRELSSDNRQGLNERQVPGDMKPYSYRRYEVTESGVSPILVPGTPQQLVYADSDEHSEEGHITESAAVRVKMVNKRNAKLDGIRREFGVPKVDVEAKAEAEAGVEARAEAEAEAEAETLALCFGSTRGVVAEAVARLQARGRSVAMVHLDRVWPFPAEAVAQIAGEGRKVVTVEQNYSGELAQLLLQESGLRAAGTVRRYDGRPFTVAEVEAGLDELIGARDG